MKARHGPLPEWGELQDGKVDILIICAVLKRQPFDTENIHEHALVGRGQLGC